jgi:hypothetical protein
LSFEALVFEAYSLVLGRQRVWYRWSFSNNGQICRTYVDLTELAIVGGLIRGASPLWLTLSVYVGLTAVASATDIPVQDPLVTCKVSGQNRYDAYVVVVSWDQWSTGWLPGRLRLLVGRLVERWL